MIPQRRTALDRFLRLFADVRAGESARVLLLAANLFLLLFAYYLLKTIREPLILGERGGGAEIKSYAAACQAVALIAVSIGFGRLAERFTRLRLIAVVTLFFASNLLVFYALFLALPAHRLATGIAFFIWVGCFNVMIVAQFWAFANDLYTRGDGERLFGIVAGGSAVGAVVGARFAKPLYKALGPFPLLPIAAGLLVLCLLFTWLVQRRSEAPAPIGRSEGRIGGGFALLLRDRYLLLVGLLSLMKNWVNTTGEYILDRRLLEVARAQLGRSVPDVEKYIAAFKSDYFTYVNTIVLVLQLLAVSRVVKYLGVRRALYVLPLVALGCYGTMVALPILAVILAGKVSENRLDYSLEKTAEQMLFLVTTREAKYKAKAVVDTFMVRAGDVLSAALVYAGTRLGFSTLGFIVANMALAALWLGVVTALAQAQQPESPAELLIPESVETEPVAGSFEPACAKPP
jgi:AAA family ATP:ADP antiporter